MKKLPVLIPALQIGFYQRLKKAQETYLLPALFRQVSLLDIGILDRQLLEFAGNEKLAILARQGLRGELLFPVPYFLSSKPVLLGYYRLLLGFSQKEFYKGPYSRFKNMEGMGRLTPATQELLPALCSTLIESAWLLANGVSELSEDAFNSLTLLTLGPQFRGSRNVALGAEAIQTFFALLKAIVIDAIVEEGDNYLIVQSAAKRTYKIEFSPDPDIAIRQVMASGVVRNRIAVEVKGGEDFSNIHNRLGEAEKSHQKAKNEGFTEFWTVINVMGIDHSLWKRETPTTTEVFHLQELVDIESQEYQKFREYLISELGI
ncbi:MAG: XcyI family restriction endonuclease [Chloroflexi bacterium]|nr:XcyI family restriction endonuclease [Chloroflexota bacterium]